MAPPVERSARPILKWAGGKRQLLPALRPYYPPMFRRYFEPFLGSGAVFLDLYNRGRLEGREAHLSDINADIIGCYRTVRDDPEGVIAGLTLLEREHRERGRDYFYVVRDERFNPARRALESNGVAARYPPDVAAMLIYLNRTGYNGLFRVNADGEFNVPAGRYAAARICDADNIRRLSAALRGRGVRVDSCPFDLALARAGRRDFVYLDPPYAPLSRTAHFRSYTAGKFGPEQQNALQRSVLALASRGAQVLLSNSVAPAIRDLYAENADAHLAGLRAVTVPARRAINSQPARRGAILEYLITNVQPAEVV